MRRLQAHNRGLALWKCQAPDRGVMSSQKELVSFYDKRYREKELRESRSFYRWILRLLRVEGGKRLLDVSCGVGLLNSFAEEKGLVSHGIDISREAVSLARKNAGRSRMVLGNAQTLPYAARSFDYVTNLGSLEHYLHPAQGVKETARVLKDEGRACILLPNSYFILDIVFDVLLTGRGPSHTQPLERFDTRYGWQQLLEANGLVVHSVFKYNACLPHGLEDIKWYFRHRKRFLTLLLSLFIPFNISYSFAFICGKKDSKQRED